MKLIRQTDARRRLVFTPPAVSLELFRLTVAEVLFGITRMANLFV